MRFILSKRRNNSSNRKGFGGINNEWLNYKLAGDRGILIYFGGEIRPETFQRIRFFDKNILKSNLPGVEETVSGYRTLFISYEPSKTDYDLVYQLKQLAQNLPNTEYQKEGVCF